MTARRVYEWTYRHEATVDATGGKIERRRHAHRCLHCNRIIANGSRVLGIRLRNRSRFIHIEEADRVAEPTSGTTNRQLFEAWAAEQPPPRCAR